jgi:hypothetical protein
MHLHGRVLSVGDVGLSPPIQALGDSAFLSDG